MSVSCLAWRCTRHTYRLSWHVGVLRILRHHYPAPDMERAPSIVMSVSVCACVCLSVDDHISATTRPIFTAFFVHVPYSRGSVLL